MIPPPTISPRTATLFPYSTLFLSWHRRHPAYGQALAIVVRHRRVVLEDEVLADVRGGAGGIAVAVGDRRGQGDQVVGRQARRLVGSAVGRMDDGADLVERDRPVRRDADRENERVRSEEHTSELQSLMRISYAVFCMKKKKYLIHTT